MIPLVPCPACRRHIRVDHDACPFCSTALPARFASRAIPGTTRRLDRLATFTFATAFTLAACGGSVDDPPAGTDKNGDASAEDARSDARDGSASGDAGEEIDGGAFDGGPADAGPDINVAPPYGAPPDDGGAAPAYGLPVDASPDVGVAPPYGAPG